MWKFNWHVVSDHTSHYLYEEITAFNGIMTEALNGSLGVPSNVSGHDDNTVYVEICTWNVSHQVIN